MRKILIILMFVCLTAGMVMAAGGAVPVARDNNGGQYITDRFVITIKPGVAPLVVNTMISGQVYTGNSRIDLLCAQNKVKSVELFYDHPVRNPVLRSLVERIYIFHIDPKLDARDVYANFAVCDDIETSDLYIVPEIFFTPNDPQISQQWALAKVNATQAWDVVHGDTTKRVIIAIDDTGVYFKNPDLQANIWINTPEDINHNGIFDAGDINGQDEDGNSYNDDVVGWDLGTADNNPEEEEPTHGTHVAGCASEVTNMESAERDWDTAPKSCA
jgi:subtilisin family serine protease